MTTADRKRSLEAALGSAIARTKMVQDRTRAVGVVLRSGETEDGQETDTVTTRRLQVDSRDNAESQGPAETG